MPMMPFIGVRISWLVLAAPTLIGARRYNRIAAPASREFRILTIGGKRTLDDLWLQTGFLTVARVIFALIYGTLCGAVPLLMGWRKRQPIRGLTGLFTCIVAAFFCGFLLAPLVAAFYGWLIYKRPVDESDESEEPGLMSLGLSSKEKPDKSQ